MTSTSSTDLTPTWKDSCQRVLVGSSSSTSVSSSCNEKDVSSQQTPCRIRLVNFMSFDSEITTTATAATTTADPWMQTALEIQSNIEKMAVWMKQKRLSYTSIMINNLDITTSLQQQQDDASLIQSTITSFTATTATEIDTLSTLLLQQQQQQQNHSPQWTAHCQGIVQILLQTLQDYIAKPAGEMLSLHNRKAMTIWQHPLKCYLWTATTSSKKNKTKHDKNDDLDAILGMEDTNEQQQQLNRQLFLPTKTAPQSLSLPTNNFLQKYQSNLVVPMIQKRRPRSMLLYNSTTKRQHQSYNDSEQDKTFSVNNNNDDDDNDKKKKKHKKLVFSTDTTTKQQQQQVPMQHVTTNDHHHDQHQQEQHEQQLQQEALLVTANLVENDLDSVQQMEQLMVDITTLLSQFAALVVEQSSSIADIQDAAATAKNNVAAGQDSLVEAKERTMQSKHIMATTIASMGVIMLVFNWLRP